MTDSDDSDCAPLVKVRSVSLPTSWEEVPKDIDFVFKVKLCGQSGKWSKLGYTLRKGVSLPYSPIISGLNLIISFLHKKLFKCVMVKLFLFLGMQFTFNHHLEPEVYGKVGRKEKGCWKFEGNQILIHKIYQCHQLLQIRNLPSS